MCLPEQHYSSLTASQGAVLHKLQDLFQTGRVAHTHKSEPGLAMQSQNSAPAVHSSECVTLIYPNYCLVTVIKCNIIGAPYLPLPYCDSIMECVIQKEEECWGYVCDWLDCSHTEPAWTQRDKRTLSVLQLHGETVTTTDTIQ